MLAVYAAQFNGGNTKITLEFLEIAFTMETMKYPSLNTGYELHHLGNTITVDKKKEGEAAINVLCIEEIEIVELNPATHEED